jgi:hypothetical protein
VSVELRVPFAGTANSDQVLGQGLSVGDAEFGNLGLAFKAAVYRTPNLVVSAGLGLSLPTASDSRMLLAGQPVVDIQNDTVLLEPLFGVAWAPNDRLYAQLGVQFDFDPSGNPVRIIDTNGNLSRAGRLRDQNDAFVSSAVGYWVYRSDTSFLTGLAVQGELHYDATLSGNHTVQDGVVTIGDLTSQINVLNGTVGVIANVANCTNVSLGVSFPLTGDHVYDWNLMAQVEYRFGPRGR